MNWKVFGLKYDKREEWAFEQMSYLLFCAEHNNRIGLFRYKNQTGIETEPLVMDGKTLGFQSKYYTSSIASNKGDIIDSIKKAKAKNENLDELYFYINQEYSESTAKNQKKPKCQQEIETTAKKLGIKLIWRVPSHFELQLSLLESNYIFDLFFNQNPNEGKLIDCIIAHNENILKNIQTEISFNSFQTVIDTFTNHYDTILNFFVNRQTNAGAESFNAKVKAFRSQFRGVSDIPFFLYRLSMLCA